jgi:pimeloyl-ACP methyl ester carboxylesterase
MPHLLERIPVAEGVALAVDRWRGKHGPVLLVHGLASNARLWDGVAALLGADDIDVASVDLRGHGRSDKPDDGYDFETIARDLVRVLDALDAERAVVAGQSWGANVTIELAARHPDRVAAVVCVDGGTIQLAQRFATWDETWAALAPPRFDGVTASDFEAMVRERHAGWPEAGVAGALANMEVLPDGTIRPWLTRQRHEAIVRAMWEEDLAAQFARVEAPVVFVMAEGPEARWTADKRVGVEEALRALANGRALWIAGDHDLHAQRPDLVARVIAALVTEAEQ